MKACDMNHFGLTVTPYCRQTKCAPSGANEANSAGLTKSLVNVELVERYTCVIGANHESEIAMEIEIDFPPAMIGAKIGFVLPEGILIDLGQLNGTNLEVDDYGVELVVT